MKNCIIFIIVYCIFLLKYVDEIFVFDKGCICERGIYYEFFEKGGYYKKIYDL